jgi:hypothetical protein
MKHPAVFGYLAEFENPTELVEAAEKVYSEGYRKIDTYSPFPIEAASEAVGFHHTRLPLIVLIGGLTGLATAFAMQYWISVIDYPINVGGRPFNSWPAFVIVCFELTVLFSAISAVIGMFALNGLPMPYHPVFNVQRFVDASKDGFFLVIEATDPKFDADETENFLKALSPVGVWEVPY